MQYLSLILLPTCGQVSASTRALTAPLNFCSCPVLTRGRSPLLGSLCQLHQKTQGKALQTFTFKSAQLVSNELYKPILQLSPQVFLQIYRSQYSPRVTPKQTAA